MTYFAATFGRSDADDQGEHMTETKQDATKPTLHLFREREGGDVYAARDLEHAKALWKADTGQDPEDGNDWVSVPDDKSITVNDTGEKVTKTAAEWAREAAQPGCCFGENY